MFPKLTLVLAIELVLLALGCGQEDTATELKNAERVTVQGVYSNYYNLEGNKVIVKGFANMSAHDFWILSGDAFTPLADENDRKTIVHLWWDDWAGYGFKMSGEISAFCKVGSFATERQWIHYTNEVRMEDCRLAY